jgi:hypothetical protein
MRKLLASIALTLVACGGSPTPAPKPADPTATPTAAPGVLEVGEITVFDGADAMLKIHADGSTEMGNKSNGAVGWKAGPTIKTDGTFVASGEPKIQVTADGKVMNLKTNQPMPVIVTADTATITEGGKSVTIGLGADGAMTLTGGEKQPDKMPHVQGADTAGKRRSVLVFMAMMLTSDDDHAVSTPMSSSTPPAP